MLDMGNTPLYFAICVISSCSIILSLATFPGLISDINSSDIMSSFKFSLHTLAILVLS